MPKLWLIAVQEYKRQVLNKGFLIAVFSVPLLIALMIGLGMLTDRLRSSDSPLGYVDPTGWILPSVAAPDGAGRQTTLRPGVARQQFEAFESEDAARAALEKGTIQAYFVLAPDYAQSLKVDLVYFKSPGESSMSQFYDFLRLARLAHAESSADWPVSRELVVRRVLEGDSTTVRSADGMRVYDQSTPLSFLLPLFIGVGFMILLMTTSTTLSQAFAEEKANRTVEVMATSASPWQLVGGKVIGISAMGLTELVSWIAVVAVAAGLASRIPGAEWLGKIYVHPRTVAILAVVAVPTYVLFAGLMVALGSTVADVQESQQIGGMLSLVFVLPIYAIQAMVEQPGGALAVGLALFPLTSLVSYSLLTGFSSVQLGQVGVSVAILVVSAAGAIWLAGQAFRLGMLRYGKRVGWRELLGAARRTQQPNLTDARRQP